MSRRIHIVGIGGAGMSAIAKVLLERSERVTGSDIEMSAFGEGLAQAGVPINIPHRREAVTDADLVLASSAIPDDNVELVAARAASIPVMRRAAFLGELVQGYRTVAIAGTHGKTTTASMIAWILSKAGLEPSFIVGGVPQDLGTNARHGVGEVFVIEADEYDRAFLGLQAELAVITNVEHDHPDDYPSFDDFRAAFEAFAAQTKEALIVGSDDPAAAELSTNGLRRITFGLGEANWRAEELRPNDAGGTDFLATLDGAVMGIIRLRLPGEHNVRNALGALAAAHEIGVEFSAARSALADFHGVRRRFELLGEQAGVAVIDDYAHHPSEIEATLAAARSRYPQAVLWAVFQPHTYSRTQTFFDRLTESFSDADHVIVTEIYAAREAPDPRVSAQRLAASIKGQDVRYAPTLEQAAAEILQDVKSGSVILTLSAGDANRVGWLVLDELETQSKGESDA